VPSAFFQTWFYAVNLHVNMWSVIKLQMRVTDAQYIVQQHHWSRSTGQNIGIIWPNKKPIHLFIILLALVLHHQTYNLFICRCIVLTLVFMQLYLFWYLYNSDFSLSYSNAAL
jgi:hypothetical protein